MHHNIQITKWIKSLKKYMVWKWLHTYTFRQAHNSYVNFLYFSANLYIYPFLYRIYILINIKSTERTYDIKWEGRIFYCHRVMGFIGNFIIQYPFVPDHFWEKDELKAFSFSIKLGILSIFVRNFISTKFNERYWYK